MPASVTPEYLLEGATYALEQCGLLLRDANLLYRNGSYSSAVALALFAREELGRYRILLGLRKQVLRGERFTIKEIQDRCWDHVRKQEAGMMSFVLRLVTDPALAKLLDTYLNAKPDSEERKTAREQLELDDKRTKRIPVERHKQRMSALYVDAVAPNRWNRPTREISPTSALLYLQDARNDYSVQYDHYTNLEIGKLADLELYTALEKWVSRPTLSPPERPELPPWLTFKLPS
jgi:AbiV family abortive infection protein